MRDIVSGGLQATTGAREESPPRKCLGKNNDQKKEKEKKSVANTPQAGQGTIKYEKGEKNWLNKLCQQISKFLLIYMIQTPYYMQQLGFFLHFLFKIHGLIYLRDTGNTFKVLGQFDQLFLSFFIFRCLEKNSINLRQRMGGIVDNLPLSNNTSTPPPRHCPNKSTFGHHLTLMSSFPM